jgi:glycosyltransferase involved in cell wall biosynthesis
MEYGFINLDLKLVCIPAFNVEKTIGGIVKESLLHADKVIVCDDGSTDNTAKLAEQNGAEVVKHERNYGYGAALITLFDKAREKNADIMITLDGDGQHIPEFIPRLVAPLSYEGVDVVIGSRFLGGDSSSPRFGTHGIKIVTTATNIGNDIKVTDARSGFRAYSKRAIQSIHPTEYGMAASTEILTKVANKGLKLVEVPIVVSYDSTDSGNPKIPSGIKVLMNVLKFMSVRHPIVFYGFPGIGLVVAGAILGWQFLLAYFGHQTVYYGSLLGAVVLFMSGTILTATAVILYAMSILIKERQ